MNYILLFFLIVFLFYILKDTPLIEAARNGHTDIVRLLIENGADVNKGEEVRLTFTRLYGQKTAWRFLDILLKGEGFRSKFLFLTVALGNEHMFSITNLL